jgi:hypothetical protein
LPTRKAEALLARAAASALERALTLDSLSEGVHRRLMRLCSMAVTTSP